MQSVLAAERRSLDPLGAGALLAGVLFACVGLGALIGLAAGSVGAVIGIPASIVAVYTRYRGAF